MTRAMAIICGCLVCVAPNTRAASFCVDVSMFMFEIAAMRNTAVTEESARTQALSLPRAHGYEQPISGLIHWVYQQPAATAGEVQLHFINQCRAAGLDKGANSHTENQG